jgi:hypothetical protein
MVPTFSELVPRSQIRTRSTKQSELVTDGYVI